MAGKPNVLITDVKVTLVLTQEQLDVFGQRGIELLNDLVAGYEDSDAIISEIIEATHVAVQRYLGI